MLLGAVTAGGDGRALVARLNKNVRARNARVHLVAETAFGPYLRLCRYRLGNGLTVLTMLDRSAPVVSYHTWYRVGSRHETPGKTGLAHLFEHLMFSETKSRPAGEFDALLEAAGAESNAATWTDWTYYYENLPKRELELAVALESDRMANLVLRDPQVASEKEVVANERRYRVDDSVEGTADEALYKHAFTRHPYRWPTIGWMEDIQGFTTEDCRRFYRTYYAPNNATLILVGDFDEEEALRLVQARYGGMKSARIPEERIAAEPPQKKERRVHLRQPTSSEKVLVGYRSPSMSHRDYPVLTVLHEVLFGGRSGRLHRLLVEETEKATQVRGSVAPFRYEGLYEMWISMREGKRGRDGLALLDAELTRLHREPVEAPELEKAKNRLELAFLEGMTTAGGKAEQIGFYESVVGDGGAVFAQLEAYRRVTADDLRRAARTYLVKNRRTVVEVAPEAKSKGRAKRGGKRRAERAGKTR